MTDRQPLTRTRQVLELLQDGGFILSRSMNGVGRTDLLHDTAGVPVKASRNAITFAKHKCRAAMTSQGQDGATTIRWEYP